jgi:hypothetical protein
MTPLRTVFELTSDRVRTVFKRLSSHTPYNPQAFEGVRTPFAFGARGNASPAPPFRHPSSNAQTNLASGRNSSERQATLSRFRDGFDASLRP